MRSLVYFKPDFNKSESEEIETLQNEIWEALVNCFKPIVSKVNDSAESDCTETYLRHSIKIINDGSIHIMDTSTNPYMPINNRYLLKLIKENICNDDDNPVKGE